MPTATTRLLTSAVTATATTAYYATPDLIDSRRTRGWVKAALLATMVASAVPDLREARVAQPETPPDDDDLPSPLVVAGGAGALVAGIVATVATERWLFRRGERRRAAGVRWAHTRTGVVMGVVAGATAALGSAWDPGRVTR